MRKPQQPVTVLVALNKSIISRTKKLCGIFHASAESGRIELKIMDEGRDLTPEYVDHEIEVGTKGFIIGATGVTPAIEHIGRLGLPMATMSLTHKPFRNACAIHTGNIDIAKEASRLFLSTRRINSYAYYPSIEPLEWSMEREKHFLRLMGGRKNKPAVTLPRTETAAALAKLPRPIGVLAANDNYARELLDICHKAGLSVPADVSIIGVDNEEFLCESATPSLTSIEPDFEREGYEAARAVIQLLENRRTSSLVMCGIKRVVFRKSTHSGNPSEDLVDRAMEYIHARATSGITVRDVCSHLRVSQRLLSLRFRQIKHFSPTEAILDRKLTLLRKELLSSDLSIARICENCGFGSENHPKKMFRKRYHMTMKEYRAGQKAR